MPNIGGRGYVKSGNDLMQAAQMAWAGEKYTGTPKIQLKDVYWLDEEPMPELKKLEGVLYTPGEIAQALASARAAARAAGLGRRRDRACSRAALNVPPQSKPWPNPLSEQLTMTAPVDARYLNTERDLTADKHIVINEMSAPGWPKAGRPRRSHRLPGPHSTGARPRRCARTSA